VDEIQDEDLMRKQYRHWRIRIFYGMYIGYVFYYISRKSLTFAMPTLMTDLGFTKSDMGILASLMSITYGLSKFLSGVLAIGPIPGTSCPLDSSLPALPISSSV